MLRGLERTHKLCFPTCWAGRLPKAGGSAFQTRCIELLTERPLTVRAFPRRRAAGFFGEDIAAEKDPAMAKALAMLGDHRKSAAAAYCPARRRRANQCPNVRAVATLMGIHWAV
jgi:hypothetical protein